MDEIINDKFSVEEVESFSQTLKIMNDSFRLPKIAVLDFKPPVLDLKPIMLDFKPPVLDSINQLMRPIAILEQSKELSEKIKAITSPVQELMNRLSINLKPFATDDYQWLQSSPLPDIEEFDSTNLMSMFECRCSLHRVRHSHSMITFEGPAYASNHTIYELDHKYTNEKRRGGENSYKRNKPLKDLVKRLCLEELSRKQYGSAMELCEVVSQIVGSQHIDLLREFIPYTNNRFNGKDWRKPTFYKWCKEAYGVTKR